MADGVAHMDGQDHGNTFRFGDVIDKLGERTQSWVSQAFEQPSQIQQSQQPFMR